jgi:hypothetical protein
MFTKFNARYLCQLLRESVFPPQTSKPGKTPPLTFKTIHFTFLTLLLAVLEVVLSFSFLFISVESLKNHSKLQKNYKIENLICWIPHK